MPKKIQPAQTVLRYTIPPAGASTTVYFDLAKDLSMVNRRLYDQGRQYFVQSIEFGYLETAAVDTIYVSALTAGNTWMVHNAHTKGKALWNDMNRLVLDDNPSIKGKWADFKVYLDDHHKAAGSLAPLDGDGVPYKPGEWLYSTFVMPQHDVDASTGEPLAAIEYQSHLVGDDTGTSTGSTMGLVKAYGLSRAAVQPLDPAIPTGMASSFFNLLTDSGSQEPELAEVIEDQNDAPPYDQDEYLGGKGNAPCAVTQEFAVASIGSPTGLMTGFPVECGLLKLVYNGFKAGEAVAPAPLAMKITLMPGTYKGVMALPMGQ